MCTLTFIRTDRGVRLVHSRDEQRTRANGVPPEAWAAGGSLLLSPRDPDAGGTWVAARNDGAILAVMNRNPEPPPAQARSELRSRGLLIEQLAALPPERFADALRSIEARRYAPFRMFAAVPTDADPVLWAAEWDASDPAADARPVVTSHALPACWVSSGLGDSVVADRLPLFERMVTPDPGPATQDAYHRHAWSDRGAPSVFMNRPDARTVSMTVVETFSATPVAGGDGGPAANDLAATMIYLPVHPGRADHGAPESVPMVIGVPHFSDLVRSKVATPG